MLVSHIAFDGELEHGRAGRKGNRKSFCVAPAEGDSIDLADGRVEGAHHPQSGLVPETCGHWALGEAWQEPHFDTLSHVHDVAKGVLRARGSADLQHRRVTPPKRHRTLGHISWSSLGVPSTVFRTGFLSGGDCHAFWLFTVGTQAASFGLRRPFVTIRPARVHDHSAMISGDPPVGGSSGSSYRTDPLKVSQEGPVRRGTGTAQPANQAWCGRQAPWLPRSLQRDLHRMIGAQADTGASTGSEGEGVPAPHPATTDGEPLDACG